jgi:hypothetical protein
MKRLLAFVFLLFALHAQAITVVQSASATTSGTNETSLAVSFSTLPTVGNSVIVIWNLQTSVALTGVADNQSGNTYSSVAVETSSANNVDSEIWWLPSISGSTGTFTVTGTIGSAHQISITIVEVSGLTAVDKTGLQGASNNGTTLTVTASGANTDANDLVITDLSSGYTTTSSGITAPTTGYTSINTLIGTNPDYNGVVQSSYKIVSATETSAATWTVTNAFNGAAGTLATFKGSTGSSCTNNFWESTGAFAIPNGSSGSYWATSGAYSTPNCSSGTYWLKTGATGSN